MSCETCFPNSFSLNNISCKECLQNSYCGGNYYDGFNLTGSYIFLYIKYEL